MRARAHDPPPLGSIPGPPAARTWVLVVIVRLLFSRPGPCCSRPRRGRSWSRSSVTSRVCPSAQPLGSISPPAAARTWVLVRIAASIRRGRCRGRCRPGPACGCSSSPHLVVDSPPLSRWDRSGRPGRRGRGSLPPWRHPVGSMQAPVPARSCVFVLMPPPWWAGCGPGGGEAAGTVCRLSRWGRCCRPRPRGPASSCACCLRCGWCVSRRRGIRRIRVRSAHRIDEAAARRVYLRAGTHRFLLDQPSGSMQPPEPARSFELVFTAISLSAEGIEAHAFAGADGSGCVHSPSQGKPFGSMPQPAPARIVVSVFISISFPVQPLGST